MRKPKRDRRSVTVTLKPSTIEIIGGFAEKYGGNRSSAVEVITRRYAYLLSTAGLPNIAYEDFRTICLAFNGISTADDVDARGSVKAQLHYRLTELQDSREEINERPLGFFAEDSIESRTEFLKLIENERVDLGRLADIVSELNYLESALLLERIEEVYGYRKDEESLDDLCKFVFDKYQRRLKI